MSDDYFSVRMRASRGGTHVSGAERITKQVYIPTITSALTSRALNHSFGVPDEVHITVDQIRTTPLIVDQLPVKNMSEMGDLLDGLPEIGYHIAASEIRMRGATLIDVHTGARLEPDPERGVRVSMMDWEFTPITEEEDHFRESVALATKVHHCPGMVAELAISNDPGFTSGYVVRNGVFHRIPKMKELGQRGGGRAFYLDTTVTTPQEAIAFLEHRPVLVRSETPM
ncbi:6-carboxyhexanoate--CoA ligase [Corynebacterium pyruviciproducens]